VGVAVGAKNKQKRKQNAGLAPTTSSNNLQCPFCVHSAFIFLHI